ncbi:family 43 glycosylhydrolase [Nocardioides sp. BP30]|uniref:family 43 glycosylhydrolase n=1 Tax=Nocardioides sp. BP30 TaxID=3036374 RepID=UPI0024698410|nr:family 43 glycosylhydrolase [Nocardioides sp. BP30]WGL52323.1 family 43 glycosylhydrolase [Nocardioides sp. BP30]
MQLVPSRPRPGRRARRVLVTVAVLLTCAVPAAVAIRPVPLDWKHTVGDPSVVKTTKNYVVIATGAKVNRALSKNGKVWKWKSSALPNLPSWAKVGGGDIWAADMEKVGSRYVLYFAAPVKGKTGTSRCIGVATSSSAKGTFVPVGTAPLVCPSTFKSVPTAGDRVIDQSVLDGYTSAVQSQAAASRTWAECKSSAASPTTSVPTSPTTGPTSGTSSTSSATTSTSPSQTGSPTPTGAPTSTPPVTGPTVYPDTCGPSPSAKPTKPATPPNVIGAIDPSFFLDSDGTPYLLYKTDGRPSSIRILKLSADGLHPAAGAYSEELVDDAGVLENPVMVERDGIYYLFNSYGDYSRCSYATVWRASGSLHDWSGSPAHSLLTRKSTHKLCGPGGADVLVQPKKTTMYFEAWTCNRSYKPCGAHFWAYGRKYERKHPVRALYAVKLGFANGAPYVKKYLKGSKH